MTEEEKLEVVGWCDYDSDFPTADISNERQHIAARNVIEKIRENNYVFSGTDHQNYPGCVPVFKEGSCLRCSMRAWAMYMAMAYNDVDENGQPVYMDYYYDVDEDPNRPEEEEGAEPNMELDDSYPVAIKQDFDILFESAAMGMEFMTTDKALLVIYPYVLKYIEAKKKQ